MIMLDEKINSSGKKKRKYREEMNGNFSLVKYNNKKKYLNP